MLSEEQKGTKARHDFAPHDSANSVPFPNGVSTEEIATDALRKKNGDDRNVGEFEI